MRPRAFTRYVAAMLALSAAPHGAWASSPSISLDDIGTTCLETPLLGCYVVSAGFLNGDGGPDEGAPFVAWQTQMGFTHEDGVRGGFVLFAHGDDGWGVLGSGIEGEYGLPGLAEGGLLHIPGYTGGTGMGNVDRLYMREASSRDWREIDMDAWLGTIGDMLPDGLAIWKGVDYDLRQPSTALYARTLLWRDSDANCCATGGEAIITLEIEGDRLIATGVRYLPPEQ